MSHSGAEVMSVGYPSSHQHQHSSHHPQHHHPHPHSTHRHPTHKHHHSSSGGDRDCGGLHVVDRGGGGGRGKVGGGGGGGEGGGGGKVKIVGNPLCKLTVDLIKTYRHINEVCVCVCVSQCYTEAL